MFTITTSHVHTGWCSAGCAAASRQFSWTTCRLCGWYAAMITETCVLAMLCSPCWATHSSKLLYDHMAALPALGCVNKAAVCAYLPCVHAWVWRLLFIFLGSTGQSCWCIAVHLQGRAWLDIHMLCRTAKRYVRCCYMLLMYVSQLYTIVLAQFQLRSARARQ
jgi:hypothetical protein